MWGFSCYPFHQYETHLRFTNNCNINAIILFLNFVQICLCCIFFHVLATARPWPQPSGGTDPYEIRCVLFPKNIYHLFLWEYLVGGPKSHGPVSPRQRARHWPDVEPRLSSEFPRQPLTDAVGEDGGLLWRKETVRKANWHEKTIKIFKNNQRQGVDISFSISQGQKQDKRFGL